MVTLKHPLDCAGHLFQYKIRSEATHQAKLFGHTWADFEAILFHAFDGDVDHIRDTHDLNAFEIVDVGANQQRGIRGRWRKFEDFDAGMFQLRPERQGKRVQARFSGAINRRYRQRYEGQARRDDHDHRGRLPFEVG